MSSVAVLNAGSASIKLAVNCTGPEPGLLLKAPIRAIRDRLPDLPQVA